MSSKESVNSNEEQGDDIMNSIEYKKLDLSKLKNRKRKSMTTEESLKDIITLNCKKQD